MEKKNSIDITTLDRVKKVIDSIDTFGKSDEEVQINFEYLMGSCFPSMFQNVMDRIRNAHTQGYIEGIADSNNLTMEEIFDKVKLKVENND